MCLANSWKEGGRCVAGLDLANKRWVRPISAIDGGALSNSQCSAAVGGSAREVAPLDLIEIGGPTHRPELGQPENYLIDSSTWKIAGQVSAESLVRFAVDAPELLYGTSDRVVEADARNVRASLALIRVNAPQFHVRKTNSRGQLRVQFSFGGVPYNLAVTDTQEWARLVRYDVDTYSQGDWLFTVSLGGTFLGARYKLVACGLQLKVS